MLLPCQRPATGGPNLTARAGRRLLAGLAALAAAAFLSGYVVPAPKVLAQWSRASIRPSVRVPVELPVARGDQSGTLYVAGPGRHALALAGEPVRSDPGPAGGGELAALWRGLDLWAVASPADLAAALEAAGVDLRRAGYGRTEGSGDGVAFTLGAQGEGEPDLAQVWFARSPLWPVRLRLPGAGELVVDPPAAGGWPARLQVGGFGVLTVTGPARPVARPPAWTRAPAQVPGAAPALSPGWRGAFERAP